MRSEKRTKGNTREYIYNKIREDIIYGRLRPGERLLESELTRNYQVSRTPVREAIRQLQSEGFVNVISNRGATVTKLSIQEVDEIYGIRAILEAYAVRLAVEKITKNDLNNLLKIQKKLEENASIKDYEGYIENNIKFHFFFPEISGNKNLLRTIQDLRRCVYRYQYITLTIPGSFDPWLKGHRKIIDALIKKDAELAAKNMENHLEDIRRVSIDFFKKFPQGL